MAALNKYKECPKCYKKNITFAERCEECNADLSKAKVVETELTQEAYKGRSVLVFLTIVCVVVALVIFYQNYFALSKTENTAVRFVQLLKDTMKSPDSFILKEISYSQNDDSYYFKVYYSAQNSFGAQLADTYYTGYGVTIETQEEMKQLYENNSPKQAINANKISRNLKK